MQRGDDYMMRQVPSYQDNPAMASTPEMQNYYDDTVSMSLPEAKKIYLVYVGILVSLSTFVAYYHHHFVLNYPAHSKPHRRPHSFAPSFKFKLWQPKLSRFTTLWLR